MNREPLLSICIPTYNRGHFLETSLKILVPQCNSLEGKVELVVSDNASTDSTQSVITTFNSPFLHYSRNNDNIGGVPNVIKSTRAAKGEFLWILSDHNLVEPGALEALVSILEQQSQINIFYSNFKCAKYPEHWPETLVTNTVVDYEYVANQDTDDRTCAHWYDLVRPETSMCTQLYAHIIRRSIWKEYWETKSIVKAETPALTVYPHTVMIIETLFKETAFYIGSPLLTIFNGAQTWTDAKSKLRVLLIGYTDLIDVYEKRGLSQVVLNEAKEWLVRQSSPVLKALVSERMCFSTLSSLYFRNITRAYIRKPIWKSILHLFTRSFRQFYLPFSSRIRSIILRLK